MLDKNKKLILTGQGEGRNAYMKTKHVATVRWRGEHAGEYDREVWIDQNGDLYVMGPGLSRFVRLTADEISSFEIDSDSSTGWERIDDGLIMRRLGAKARSYELLEIREPSDHAQVDEADEIRAYLWTVDLDDLDPEHMVVLLDTCGYIDLRAGVMDYRLALAIGCGARLDATTVTQAEDYLGDALLAREVVACFGKTWQVPKTYHETDEGYNGPWSDSYDPDLLPWGSLTRDEVVMWMCALGCGEHAPTRTLYQVVDGGCDTTAYVFAAGWEPLADRVAFESLDAIEAYGECIGSDSPIMSCDIGDARAHADDPYDPLDVISYARGDALVDSRAGRHR